jgi:hypothetical protein
MRRTNTGVSISFVDKQADRHNAIEAAYCIVAIPLIKPNLECFELLRGGIRTERTPPRQRRPTPAQTPTV